MGPIGEWRKFITGKNSTGRRWDLNPGLCRKHGHYCKRSKPLRHLALLYILFSSRLYRMLGYNVECNKSRIVCVVVIPIWQLPVHIRGTLSDTQYLEQRNFRFMIKKCKATFLIQNCQTCLFYFNK